jgi:hypothetical protein
MIAIITSKACAWRAFPNFDSTSVKFLAVKIELRAPILAAARLAISRA